MMRRVEILNGDRAVEAEGTFRQFGNSFEDHGEFGPANFTTAVIEMLDGTVRSEPVEFIRFIDPIGQQVESIGEKPTFGAISHEKLDSMQAPLHDIPEIADFVDGLVDMDTIFTKNLYPKVEAGLKATEGDSNSIMGQFWLHINYVLGFEEKKLSQLCDLIENLRTWEPTIPTTEDNSERDHENIHSVEVEG